MIEIKYMECFGCGLTIHTEDVKCPDCGRDLKQVPTEVESRVAELEARLKDCESALLGMVEQYCRVSERFTERECSHDFLDGPEQAFDYLTRFGFAEWLQNENIILKEENDKR